MDTYECKVIRQWLDDYQFMVRKTADYDRGKKEIQSCFESLMRKHGLTKITVDGYEVSSNPFNVTVIKE